MLVIQGQEMSTAYSWIFCWIRDSTDCMHPLLAYTFFIQRKLVQFYSISSSCGASSDKTHGSTTGKCDWLSVSMFRCNRLSFKRWIDVYFGLARTFLKLRSNCSSWNSTCLEVFCCYWNIYIKNNHYRSFNKKSQVYLTTNHLCGSGHDISSLHVVHHRCFPDLEKISTFYGWHQ